MSPYMKYVLEVLLDDAPHYTEADKATRKRILPLFMLFPISEVDEEYRERIHEFVSRYYPDIVYEPY